MNILAGCRRCGASVPPGNVGFCTRGCYFALRLETRNARFWQHIAIGDASDCWPWTGPQRPRGYGSVRWSTTEQLSAHRVAWELAHGEPIPDGLVIRHSCDNPPCCNPSHLELGTVADNVHDALERGGRSRGLTSTDVDAIRARLAQGHRLRAIATDFHVSNTAIWKIAHGKTWKSS